MEGFKKERYKEVSWTGLLGHRIDSEKLDCISITGSLTKLLNDGDRKLWSFSICPTEPGLVYDKNNQIIVKVRENCPPVNAENCAVGKGLRIYGSFIYEEYKNKESRIIGIIYADNIEFLGSRR